MEMHHILETLNKVDSKEGKIRFLEKCLFDEKNSTIHSEILALLRKIKKDRTSFEELHIEQLDKEKRESVIEEVTLPTAEKKIKKETKIKETKSVKLEALVKPESTIEEIAKESALINEITPTASIKDEFIDKQGYIPGESNGLTKGNYIPGVSTKKDYEPRAQQERDVSRYTPKTDLPRNRPEQEDVSEEEYKRRELLKVSREAETKKEEYRQRNICDW